MIGRDNKWKKITRKKRRKNPLFNSLLVKLLKTKLKQPLKLNIFN